MGLLAAMLAAAASVGADDHAAPAAAPDAGHATEEELKVLRGLLGLPPAAPVQAAPEPAPSHEEVEQPAEEEEPAPKASSRAAAAPQKKAARPPVKPVAKRTTRTTSTTASTSSSVPSTTAPGSPAAPADVPAPPSAPAVEAAPAIPAPGTVVSAKNMEQWKHLLGPSVRWSIERGATLPVAAAEPMPLEKEHEEATQRYHAQVALSPDKRSMRNYVAGIPFPLVTDDDPDAAPKMMFNMENRINQDDLDIRNFACDTGKLDRQKGFQLERHYAIENFRRLYDVGRVFVDPKPNRPSPDGVRYREMLNPVVEPFDLKGAGFTYIRFLDPNRQDDSWLYYPQFKRVRRLSTAQRSEGVFGQDVDLDSYGGFAGNPAWTTWTFLGRKTILASLHARNPVAKFEAAPANFFPEDQWEPREVYVILGISQLGGYNFGRRIIYLDRESWLIPYTEIYDLKGQLWRTLIHTWKFADRPKPDAKRAVYTSKTPFIGAFTLIDMQLEHATMCQFPAAENPDEEGWYYHFGAAEGTVEDEFSVSKFIGAGH